LEFKFGVLVRLYVFELYFCDVHKSKMKIEKLKMQNECGEIFLFQFCILPYPCEARLSLSIKANPIPFSSTVWQ
jgi:hypothetical protein